MKHALFVLLFAISNLLQAKLFDETYTQAKKTDTPQVVIWGHKPLGIHTHSYVHAAFYKAFSSLGFKTYWLDAKDPIDHLDFSNTLFITEGQVDQGIPLDPTAYYVIHNCDQSKYIPWIENGQCIILQVYTHDCLKRREPKLEPCIHYSLEGNVIYMPWATDLLPKEIDEIKHSITKIEKEPCIHWIGTIWGGTFGNEQELTKFTTAALNDGISFLHHRGKSFAENVLLIQKSLMAPAIVGTWQKENGYIPCRIFKNISYGQMGVTNSKTVYDLFEGKIVYNEDEYALFYDAKERLKTLSTEQLWEMMDMVKNHHTYLNRIEMLFRFIDMRKEMLGK